MINRALLPAVLIAGLTVAAAGCVDSRSQAHAVYVLVDTSGTYASEAGKARPAINYLLGTLQPGDQLPGHRDLAASYGVSLGAAREAISILIGDGHVETRAGRGTYVAERTPSLQRNGVPVSLKCSRKRPSRKRL